MMLRRLFFPVLSQLSTVSIKRLYCNLSFHTQQVLTQQKLRKFRPFAWFWIFCVPNVSQPHLDPIHRQARGGRAQENMNNIALEGLGWIRKSG